MTNPVDPKEELDKATKRLVWHVNEYELLGELEQAVRQTAKHLDPDFIVQRFEQLVRPALSALERHREGK